MVGTPNKDDPLIKEFEEMISSHKLPMYSLSDKVIWDKRTNGQFAIEFAYLLIFDKDQTLIN